MGRVTFYLSGLLGLLVTIAVTGLFPVFAGGDSDRSIHIKGIFVLVDEVELLNRIKRVSAINPERQTFVDDVYSMLNREPFIASSTIRYSWPNEVEIEITEINPVATVNASALLLSDCRIVSGTVSSLPASLFNINVNQVGLDKGKCGNLMRILADLKRTAVESVTMLENDDYILDVDGRQLVIGRDSLVDNLERIKRVVALMKAGKIKSEYVDMRYVSGFSVRKVVTL